MKTGITADQARVIFETVDQARNDSISAGWTWDQARRKGWFGYRTKGPQPVIASSWHLKRTRWHYLDGYSS